MGNIAASGGYYIAMPAGKVFAEPTTITGSIGVFAMIPNVSELAKNNGVRVELIRAGDIKAGGSPFQPLRSEERQPWQDMVDGAYDRFLSVIRTGRPALTREKLLNEKITRTVSVYGEDGLPLLNEQRQPVTRIQTRYRADGGSFTPQQALELGLIDEIGDVHAAIRHAANAAGLTDYEVISYRREPTLTETLLGIQATQPAHPLSTDSLANTLTPRLWYLSPGYELSGSLSKP
jgi:protease-4